MEKKPYAKPEIEVIELPETQQLLQASGPQRLNGTEDNYQDAG